MAFSLFGGGASSSAGGTTGTATSGAPASGGLFGGLNKNTSTPAGAASGSSLFGGGLPSNNNSNNTSAPSGGLFGGAAPASNSSGAGGLFGASAAPASTTPAQTGSSLFGGALGASTQPAQPSGGGLFGGLTGASKPAQPAGSSLFGGGASNQPAANTGGSSLFGGGLGAASKPPAAGNSLFGSTAQPSQQGPAQTQDMSFSDSTTMPSNPSYFNQLLERGKKRQTEEQITPFGELPQLELGLADISRKVRNLGQGGPSAGVARGGDARAHYLLSASGVNTTQALRDLQRLADEHTTQPIIDVDPTAITGVKLDLAHKYQDDFQKMVDSRIKRAQDDFNKMIEEQLRDVDWDAHRQHIYEHFGLKKPQHLDGGRSSVGTGTAGFGRSGRRSRALGATTNGKSFGLPGLSKSIIGTPGPKGARVSQFADVADKLPAEGMRTAPEDRILRVKQERYSDRVKELNVLRLQERGFGIFNKFADVETEPSHEDTSMLVNAYKALAEIVGEDPAKENLAEPGAIRPRQFAKDYLDDSPNARGLVAIRKRILEGSRRYLEKLFFSQLDATVLRNPREANIGGVPTSLAKVKGFVRVQAARRELGPDVELLQEINGDFCWVVIFYLLRSGLLKEAVTYIEENRVAFRQIDRKFMNYLEAYVASSERRLPPKLQTEINNDYTQRSKFAPEDSVDPYKMVCYKIIGRCDLARHLIEGVNSDMMDFLWMQFTLAREYNRVDEFAHEAYGLDEVRTTIKDICERYFGPNSDIPNAPTTLFFMQVLAGRFENAIAELYPHSYVSATHFAIALDYYGLLRVGDITSSDDLLSYTTRQQPQLAFGSMVGFYTRDFRTANPTAAVDYLTLICLNADLDGDLGRTQRELCHQALTELVLETREFAQLLGDIRADGQRIQGAIEQRLKLIGLEDEEEFLRHITFVAARTAEDQSRTTDAALLYHLAEDYDKVVQICNEAMSLALTTELGEQPQRLTPLKPRVSDQTTGDQVPAELQGSLSLTAVDDPIDLARNFRSLYGSNQMYYSKLRDTNRDCCNLLIHLADARKALEAGAWATAIDFINDARVLPTEARGNMTAIRQSANAFNDMPVVVSRTIGHVMLWAIVACKQQIALLRGAEFDTPAQQDLIKRCSDSAESIMLFNGLIRYKLPARIVDMLARAEQETMGY